MNYNKHCSKHGNDIHNLHNFTFHLHACFYCAFGIVNTWNYQVGTITKKVHEITKGN